MATVKCILGTVVLLTLSLWAEAGVLRNSTDQHEVAVSERLELANKDLGGDILTGDGDSGAFRRVRRNADACVETTCKWPSSSDGEVYVPYVIDDRFSLLSKRLIWFAMATFAQSTCVHFKPRTCEKDYLNIFDPPEGRCSSYIGRQGGAQKVALNESCCMDIGIVQHELLHALGFRHEQSRSDRDDHIKVLWDNIITKLRHNFNKHNTHNQGSPYDYNSIMQYSRYAFSKNGLPTLEAVPIPVKFEKATEMNPTDIDRVNRLYCRGRILDPSALGHM